MLKDKTHTRDWIGMKRSMWVWGIWNWVNFLGIVDIFKTRSAHQEIEWLNGVFKEESKKRQREERRESRERGLCGIMATSDGSVY